ncbi:MAG: SPFH domain-containing protein [Candidatus Magasanikbacteria bacterium]|nr:SPFH domain-containing protein [Candidatus Magasanikbacteria bacterium]
MKRNFSVIGIIGFAIAILASTGCTEEVPGGYVGMVKSPSGFEEDILAPGNHTCFGRDTMYLLEASDQQMTVSINQLCADQVNFRFDIGVLFSVDRNNQQAVKASFQNITPAVQGGGATPRITGKQLFDMYVKPAVDQQARKVISRYQTSEIVVNRARIIEEINSAVNTAFSTSLVKIKMLTVNNDDYPDFVTKAQEEKAKRRVEIETEKAEQEKRVIQAENQLKIAELKYKVDLVGAAMIADSNKIIGASISDGYLAWWQLKVLGEAASGPNNWGFIPYSDFVNQRPGIGNRLTSSGLVDAELIKRIEDARKSAQAVNAAEAKPPVASAPKK